MISFTANTLSELKEKAPIIMAHFKPILGLAVFKADNPEDPGYTAVFIQSQYEKSILAKRPKFAINWVSGFTQLDKLFEDLDNIFGGDITMTTSDLKGNLVGPTYIINPDKL